MGTMKLRLRSLESKETVRIEVPDPCTLQHLKQLLSQSLSSSPSSPSSLRLSLNRKDELCPSSSQDSLRSLGITSGDLLFYTFNLSAFSSSQPHVDPTIPEGLETLIQSSDSDLKKPRSKNSQFLEEPQSLGSDPEGSDLNMADKVLEKNDTFDSLAEREETLEFPDAETIDVDNLSVDMVGRKYSKPFFLRRVLREELGDDRNAHKLLVIAVHTVLLESGLIALDLVSGSRVNRFHIPDEWPFQSFTMSLSYTLPELLNNRGNDSSVTQTVMLKFQSLGRFVNVYGSLANNASSVLHRVCLDESRFAPAIDFVWANSCPNSNIGDVEENSERQVFEFWKIVKDELALPLLIDICENAGLPPPACFMRLPSELTMKILEALPGLDIASVGCVCSNLRYLSYNDDLWKLKFFQEFGPATGKHGVHRWRERFATMWEYTKKKSNNMETSRVMRGYPNMVRPFYFPPVRRDSSPFGFPIMMGGDYDRFPGLGISSPFGQLGGYHRHQGQRGNFAPNCNFRGFDS